MNKAIVFDKASQGGAEFPTQKYLLATHKPVDKSPCIIYQNKENGLQFDVYEAELHIFWTGKTARFQKVHAFLWRATGQKLNVAQKSWNLLSWGNF